MTWTHGILSEVIDIMETFGYASAGFKAEGVAGVLQRPIFPKIYMRGSINMSRNQVAEMNDITKAFSSNIVLNGVKLSINEGEVDLSSVEKQFLGKINSD